MAKSLCSLWLDVLLEPAAGAPDIEITREMESAGLDVFWMHDPAGDDSRQTVREIFCAMMQARSRSHR